MSAEKNVELERRIANHPDLTEDEKNIIRQDSGLPISPDAKTTLLKMPRVLRQRSRMRGWVKLGEE